MQGIRVRPDGGHNLREKHMPRGDKSAYTDKQKRKAGYMEASFKRRGMSDEEAEARAWAIVNKIHGGGEKSGSGRGKPENKEVYKKGGRKGGAASAKRSKSAKSRSAKKAATTRAKKKKSKSKSKSKTTKKKTTKTRRKKASKRRA